MNSCAVFNANAADERCLSSGRSEGRFQNRFFAISSGVTKSKDAGYKLPSPLRKGRGIEGEGKKRGKNDGSRIAVRMLQQSSRAGFTITVSPLTPTLSPSEGARENLAPLLDNFSPLIYATTENSENPKNPSPS